MKTIFMQIVGFVTYSLLCIISLLPLPVLYGVSYLFAVLPMRWYGYRRTVIITNLSRSFPDMTYEEIRRTTKEFYLYLGRVIAESVWLLTASERSVLKRFAIENGQVLETLQKNNQSVIIMIPHMGNWEFLRACNGLAYFGKPSGSPVYGPAQRYSGGLRHGGRSMSGAGRQERCGTIFGATNLDGGGTGVPGS